MDWKEMHIGIDLGLRMVQSNQYNKLQKEEKDYLINNIIDKLINDSLSTDENQLNVVDDDTIQLQYAVLESVLTTKEYTNLVNKGRYVEVELPKFNKAPIVKGLLYANHSYEVVTPGATDLAAFGIANPEVKDKFTYQPNLVKFVPNGGTFSFTIVKGYVYRIVRTDGVNFVTYGAQNNLVGTEFTANASVSLNDVQKETTLEIIAGLPTWDGITTLRLTKSISMFRYTKSSSLVYTDCTFGAGNIRKGYYYRVVKPGLIAGIKDFGAEYEKLEEGYTFLATKDGVPLWADSGVRLSEYMLVPNRLPAIKDKDNLLNHIYGTTHSSPIAYLIDGKLQVYHDNKFTISKIILEYVRTPMRVNSTTNIDSDMNEGIHTKIVDKVVSYLAATDSRPNYQALKVEETNGDRRR